MKNNKKIFIPLIFIAISFIIGILSFTINFIPIFGGIYKTAFATDVNKSNNIISKLEKAIKSSNSIISKNIVGLDSFIEVYGVTQKLIDRKFLVDDDIGYILKDEGGNLHFPVYNYDTKPNAKKVVDMKNYFNDLDIPFSFVLVMPKDDDANTRFKKGMNVYMNSTKNSENFMTVLKENGINYLDLRKSAVDDNLDIVNSFFKTDHHWKTETAFWAFKELINYIERDFGFKLDQNSYYTDLTNYKVNTLQNSFLGSLGKRMGRLYSGVDDYTIITPNFETNLKLYRGFNKDFVSEGSFEDTIIDKKLSDPNASITTNRYASYFSKDDDFTTVINENAPNDYKVLIIKDSFALPTAAFLSLTCKEVTMVDFRAAINQSVKEYINNNDYDLILMLYGSNTLSSDVMFDLK